MWGRLMLVAAAIGLGAALAAGCRTPAAAELPTTNPTPTSGVEITEEVGEMPTMENLIPMPVSATEDGGAFTLTAGASIYVEPATEEMVRIGEYLADRLNPATGLGLRVVEGAPPPSPQPPPAGGEGAGNLYLTTVGADPELGEEGYELTITPELVTLAAPQPVGLFRGVQTIRQMLPPAIEGPTVQAGPWQMATGRIWDKPRFGWRGMMLDVARHFFGVEEMKRLIDLMALYKLNRLHIHLSDDQGWRIAIGSWPNLAAYGGSTEVGGGPGGYYTQEEYAEIVGYAASRYIVVVPEIDMPGHTNAALASYAELNCDGVARPLYTGTEVGFSSLCIGKEITLNFAGDVVREIAALTPGPYFHIGGDEALATSPEDYVDFIDRVQAIVQSYGKQAVGTEEIGQAHLLPTSIAQHWASDTVKKAVGQGAKAILSPATRTYLDMKYDESTPLGLNWAGYVEVQDAYTWDPATQVEGVGEEDVLGVEALLWTETIETMDDIEYMTFPRLAGHAEIGWSPAAGRSWEEYRVRLGAQGARWTVMGVDFYRSPQVPWE
jgi:hexosaminidase